MGCCLTHTASFHQAVLENPLQQMDSGEHKYKMCSEVLNFTC